MGTGGELGIVSRSSIRLEQKGILIQMADRDTWKFINTFASWLSALGSLAAVITSLYLARRSDQIRLRISAGVRILVSEGDTPGSRPEYVWVSITNISRRATTLTNLSWKFRLPYMKGVYIWNAPRNPFSSALPITLNDGQTANYALGVKEFSEKFSEYARSELSGWRNAWKKYFSRFLVATSTGDIFSARIEKSLWDLFRSL